MRLMITGWFALRVALVLLLGLQLAGCSPAYLWQATAGQLEMMRLRRPVAEVIADPVTSPELRRKLADTIAAVRFAHQTLRLPDNGSYRDYVALERTFAVWNVFAAPEFSLELRRWCFPVAGCVAYRGYFREKTARRYADRLAAGGEDVYVAGVPAYSTLGFFRDPLLSSVMDFPQTQIAGLVFHELAHQLLYVSGDTTFSESFASFVEEEGVLRWLASRADAQGRCQYLTQLARWHQVRSLLSGAWQVLQDIYSSGESAAVMRARKAGELDRLREAYRQLRGQWSTPPHFDAWFAGPLNNATLGALAAYDEAVPALRELLRREGGDLQAFYASARTLAKLPDDERGRELHALQAGAGAAGPPGDNGCRGGPG